jgi:hypothetical protein
VNAKRTILLWLLLAPFLVAQALLPASAIASVSMRCVGMPAAAAACAQSGSMAEMAKMPCCRHMASAPSSTQARLRSRTCLFKLSLINPTRVPLSPKTLRIATPVTTAPSRGAPDVASNSTVVARVATPSSSERYRRALLASHGLRAPPTS